MGVKDRPQCYFDIEVNRESAGRITFQLFSDVCPKTCKNFLCLCTGEKGIGKTTGKKLCYKGSTFHRVVKNFMIQGGDFSEGNGKGGESIYGGYFKDENFILKHDRAFLLSMANRGKHTNGSQFFITTKPAPHLDGVHVVFGLVISGFEVIEQIENLKTDAVSRPYADVRVIDTGVLVSKSAKDVLEKHKVSSNAVHLLQSSSSESLLSENELQNEKSRRKKRKRRTKVKHVKKKRKEERESEELVNKRDPSHSNNSDQNNVDEEGSRDFSTKREKLVVRPEEIPPVPENKFLLRRDVPVPNQEPEPKPLTVTPVLSDQKPSFSKSGRKIKGRGTIRYHTPPRSRSCSDSRDDESSETPPHWKEEMERLRAYRPPSGEKWSKGDKLDDTYSSRWDERSLSQRSRSWSHDGYYSDNSRERVFHMKKRRKEKKRPKHKKKSKKQKHSKKHKLTKKDTSLLPDIESSCSSSRRTKSSHEKEKRSCSSISSRRSSKKDWSRSVKGHSSSSRELQSYSRSVSRSRSYSRESSRSRTNSRSSSRDRSRSKSRSRSSRSRSRSASHSGSRSVSSSSYKSRDQRTVSRSPKKVTVHPLQSKPNKTEPAIPIPQPNDKMLVPPILNENIPVVPLSDSPPPSRWKPGQKPWKPSYERIQEMNLKKSHLISVQNNNYALIKSREANVASYHKHQKSSDSEESDSSKYRSDRSSDHHRRSKSRSSRSRSYTRSYSRSRSFTHSRSRSRSKYHSDSSSYHRSSSYDSYSENRNLRKRSTSSEQNFDSKEKKSSSESDLYRHQNNTDYQSPNPSKSVSTSGSSPDSDMERKLLAVWVNQVKNSISEVVNSFNTDQEQDRCKLNDNGEEQKQRSDDDEECEPSSKQTSVKDMICEKPISDNTRAGTSTVDKLESTSYSPKENKSYREASDKEEGEASSESDTSVSDSKSMSKTRSKSSEVVSSFVSDGNSQTLRQEQSSESESSQSSLENNLRKSKKMKKQYLDKLWKVKAVKNKSKGIDGKKHKGKKRKPEFHWQPPLEFGEEEDDEMILEKLTTQISKVNNRCGDHGENEDSSEGSRQSKRHSVYHASPNHIYLNKDITKQKHSFNTLSPKKNLDAGEENKFISKNIKSSQVESEDESEIGNIGISDQISYGTIIVEALSPVRTKLSTNNGKTKNQYLQTNQLVGGPVYHENNGNEPTGGKEENAELNDSNSLDFPPTEEEMKTEKPEVKQNVTVDKWKPVQAASTLQTPTNFSLLEVLNCTVEPEVKPQGLRIEIKSKNKVRPGSLFDEVRKTARLNQRPRNQESSSEERSSSRDDKSRSRSLSRSRSKSKSKSRDRTKSRSRTRSSSLSRSRSRSSSYSYRSRSYRSRRNRRVYSREWTRSRSSSYHTYRRHRSYSRSRSRSSSYDHRRRSRSRSYTYDSYYSRSRSRSKRSYSYRRSRSSDRRSRSQRSYRSYSGSDRSSSHHRSRSESSSYS
ncbi:NK-tumor recognition protein isoform X2 [Microcaecilia unicolor]|uniref:peptidylprolyl isomerase n=1 Tax=Microcaecilia unicolor TaxID=1415580 RepID=A0A6P7XJZ8_9AMPH|nr:NK-tumor recognition protein isoform X2 [Microcaecilia unicolor]